ncbi:hypothetical protein N7463_008807 [Penicillium fimorum]|uniref:Uncharacterized protein n=1 Tax=Penicillium fimorum TaxID=1882269 RepID=A0A9W9XQQ3_9EURO|nr:hypothetical protein N7463_008807 [Penicillium fimorum]
MFNVLAMQCKQGTLSAYTSLIEADDDITLALNDLPDVEIVRLEGATGSYDSVAEKYALDFVRIRWDAEAGKVGSHHTHMLSHDPRGLVRGPRARVDLLITPANERDREVVHHRAVGHRAVEHSLREEARHVFWPGRQEVHAHALAERLGELGRVDNLVVDAQAAALGADELDAKQGERKVVRLVCPDSARVRLRELNHRLRFLMRVMRRSGGGELPDVLLHEREQTLGRGLVHGLRLQARVIMLHVCVMPTKTIRVDASADCGLFHGLRPQARVIMLHVCIMPTKTIRVDASADCGLFHGLRPQARAIMHGKTLVQGPAVWLARGDHLVLVEWTARKVRAEEAVELGPLVEDGLLHGAAARTPDILVERVLAVCTGDLAPLDAHAVLVDLGPHRTPGRIEHDAAVLDLEPDLMKVVLDGEEDARRPVHRRLDGLYAVHELLRHTFVPKRLCTRSEVVLVEDFLTDGCFYEVVEWVRRRIDAFVRMVRVPPVEADVWPTLILARRQRNIGVGDHAEEGMLVRPRAEFLTVVRMVDSCAMEHLKEETGAGCTDCAETCNLRRRLLAVRVDGRLEEDEEVIVEVAVIHERVHEARVLKALSADVFGCEDRGLAALDSDDLLQPLGVINARDHRTAIGQGSDVIGSQCAQGKLGEDREGLRVAGEGNDIRDGFVNALLSGIYDGQAVERGQFLMTC